MRRSERPTNGRWVGNRSDLNAASGFDSAPHAEDSEASKPRRGCRLGTLRKAPALTGGLSRGLLESENACGL